LGPNPTMRDPPPLRKWLGPIGDLIYPDRSKWYSMQKQGPPWPLSPSSIAHCPRHQSSISTPLIESFTKPNLLYMTHPKILISSNLIRYFPSPPMLPSPFLPFFSSPTPNSSPKISDLPFFSLLCFSFVSPMTILSASYKNFTSANHIQPQFSPLNCHHDQTPTA